MKEYKIKYLNKLPAFKTVGNELKGLPGLGELKINYYVTLGSKFLSQKVFERVQYHMLDRREIQWRKVAFAKRIQQVIRNAFHNSAPNFEPAYIFYVQFYKKPSFECDIQTS